MKTASKSVALALAVCMLSAVGFTAPAWAGDDPAGEMFVACMNELDEARMTCEGTVMADANLCVKRITAIRQYGGSEFQAIRAVRLCLLSMNAEVNICESHINAIRTFCVPQLIALGRPDLASFVEIAADVALDSVGDTHEIARNTVLDAMFP